MCCISGRGARIVPGMSPAKKTKKTMSAAHKAALAEGRANAAAVRRYLELIESSKPKRGRKRTPDSIRKQLAGIDAKLEDASVLTRLQLVQKRSDLSAELTQLEAAGDSDKELAAAEKAFIASAAAYAAAKGLTYNTFRKVGVPADVLKRAKISR